MKPKENFMGSVLSPIAIVSVHIRMELA